MVKPPILNAAEDGHKPMKMQSEYTERRRGMTNTELLKDYIEKSGLKLTYIAEKLGISRSALWKKINNASSFDQYQIEKMCDLLGIRTLKEKEDIFFAKM